MNIIEAMQAAESGSLITNGFRKSIDGFLKYIGEGLFFQYRVVDGRHEYKYDVRKFSFAEIIANDWEIVEDKYFKK